MGLLLPSQALKDIISVLGLGKEYAVTSSMSLHTLTHALWIDMMVYVYFGEL